MSDQEIKTISFMLGQIDTKVDAMQKTLEEITKNGCPMGLANQKAIADIQSTVSNFKGLGRKIIMVMIATGVGSVGLQKALSGLLTLLAQ